MLRPLSRGALLGSWSGGLHPPGGPEGDGGRWRAVRLDKARFLDDVPNTYYVSVKDAGEVLADRASVLSQDTLALNWR